MKLKNLMKPKNEKTLIDRAAKLVADADAELAKAKKRRVIITGNKLSLANA